MILKGIGNMTKDEAIAKWGKKAVELARDYYETDFEKFLFREDIPADPLYEFAIDASEEDQIERCTRAARNLSKAGHEKKEAEKVQRELDELNRGIPDDRFNEWFNETYPKAHWESNPSGWFFAKKVAYEAYQKGIAKGFHSGQE